MQVQQKKVHFQSFGGLNFIHAFLKRSSFAALVAQHIGQRSIWAKYNHAELLQQLFFVAAINGDTLDESNLLKEQMKDHPDLKIASPDTLEYAFQELRQVDKEIRTDKGVCHRINEHAGFNGLLAALCSQVLQKKSEQGYMMDYDGHIVENTKADNAFTYKNTEGYYPVVCSIDKQPVYMQNRNGNTPESYGQKQIIETAIENCRKENIIVKQFRADACCYEKDTVEWLESKAIGYFIRAENCQRLIDALDDEPEWETVMLGHRKIEVCSIEEKIFGQEKYRRLVAYRYKQSGQPELFNRSSKGYRYYAVLTSDTKHTPLECIEIYNQRGCDGEHHFKELDHDFNWNKLPFDCMEMNTIFMYAMLTAYILFNAVKTAYSQKLDFVNCEMRLKNFILHFVTLTAKWIKTARRWVLKIFTMKDYRPVFAT
jgi:hypothetical protein